MMGIAAAPKYLAYKDSGEGWIAEIPTHWEVRRLKQLFIEKKHRANMALDCGSISFGKVVHKSDEKITEATKASYQEILCGEFLINPLNLNYDLKSLRIALSDIDAVVSSGYIVLRERVHLHKRYFKYLLYRYDVAYLKLLGSGVRQTISFNHIANSLLIVPPLDEQNAIVRFLDEKTAKIDEAISIEDQQITLLKERKQIIVQDAVTKGLKPEVSMKDSGVDWTREIPEHWEIISIARVAQVIDPNPSHRNPEYVETGYPFISTQEFIGYYDIKLETPRKISEKTVLEQESRCHFRKGSLVFSRKGTIGAVRMLPEGVRLGILDSLCVINNSGAIDADYLLMTLSAEYVASQYGPIVRGAALPQLSVGAVRNLKIILPPFEEQIAIVAHVMSSISQIDAAIKLKLDQISSFKEYRATLIDSAVTGKIKVI